MTDKHLKSCLLDVSGNSCCFNFNNYFSCNNSISTQKSFLCLHIYCFCSKMVTMVTTKISQLYSRCVKLFIHKILCSYWVLKQKYSSLLLNSAFSVSDVTQSIVVQFVQNLLKTTCSVFCRFVSENCSNLDL